MSRDTMILQIDLEGNAAEEMRKLTAQMKAAEEQGVKVETNLSAASEGVNAFRNAVDDSVDRLKVFGERGEQMASALSSISDPLERAREAQKLYNRELARGSDPVAKLDGKLGKMRASFASIPPTVKLAAGAILAFAAASGKVAVDAIQAYIESNAEAKAKSEALTEATKALEESFGEMLFVTSELGESMEALTDVVGTFAGIFNSLTETSEDGGFLGFLADWALTLIKGPLTALESFGDALVFIRDGMVAIGAIEDEAATRQAKRRKEFEKTAAQQLKEQEALLDVREEQLRIEREFEEARLRSDEDRMRELDLQRIRAEAEEEQYLRERREAADAKSDQARAKSAESAAQRREKAETAAAKASEEAKKRRDKAIEEAEKAHQERMAALAEERAAAARAAWEREFDMNMVRAQARQKQLEEEAAAVEAFQQDISRQLTSIQEGAVQAGIAFAEMGVDVASGSMTAGDAFGAFAENLGSLFSQMGVGILLSGLGLKALFEGNPAGAIGYGTGLIVAGAALSGIGSMSGGGADERGSGGRSDVGATLRQASDAFGNRDDDNDVAPTIIANFGTRQLMPEIVEVVNDANRRGRLDSNRRRR